MRLDPAGSLVRNKVSDGFAIATDDKRLAGILHRGEQTGEIRFGFMHIYSLHGGNVSPVSPVWQRSRESRLAFEKCLRSLEIGRSSLSHPPIAVEQTPFGFQVAMPRETGTFQI